MLQHVWALAVGHLQVAHKFLTCATYVVKIITVVKITYLKISLWLKYGIKLFSLSVDIICLIQTSFLQVNSSPGIKFQVSHAHIVKICDI